MGQRVIRLLLPTFLLLLMALFGLVGCSHSEDVVKSGPDAPRHPPGVNAADVNPPAGGPDSIAPKK